MPHSTEHPDVLAMPGDRSSEHPDVLAMPGEDGIGAYLHSSHAQGTTASRPGDDVTGSAGAAVVDLRVMLLGRLLAWGHVCMRMSCRNQGLIGVVCCALGAKAPSGETSSRNAIHACVR